jgi:hypothetical protein
MTNSNDRDKKRTLEELLKDLEKPMHFLATKFNIQGYERDDLKQIMCLNVIQTYNKNIEYYSRRKLGYWFLRCRWALLNLTNDNDRKNPLVKSISLDNLLNGTTYTHGE